jgi:hypothetical protein
LTFSFDFHGIHFAVLNTDAVGNDAKAPVVWLADDLKQAKERGARHFFVFGHRPAYTYKYSLSVPDAGLDIYPDNQKAFWDLMEKYKATYSCGHEHIFNAMQPRAATGGKAWQVLAGSGGAPFDAKPGESANPLDRTYAWALVTIYGSGRVQVDVLGFDDTLGETKLIKSWDM